MKFAAMFSISSLLLIVALVVVMQPRDIGGPMNIGFEEPIAISLILVSTLILAATGWQHIGQLVTWSYSLSVLGAFLLGMNFVLESCHPPREGIITDALGRVAPDELSILGAYSTSLGLILAGIVCFSIAVHNKIKANKS